MDDVTTLIVPLIPLYSFFMMCQQESKLIFNSLIQQLMKDEDPVTSLYLEMFSGH